MRHADALSRFPTECLNIQRSHNTLLVQIRRAQSKDPEVLKEILSVKNGTSKDFILMNDILFKANQGNPLLVIPKQMQQEIVIRTHERGHFGWRNTQYLMEQEYWFPQMRNKIQETIKNCIHCLLAERKQGKTEGWLQPIDKNNLPLDTYHLDHLGPIPATKKSYAHILVVVDAFSKFVWLYPTRSTTSEEVIQRLEKQATIFGNPKRIISDRGTAFTSGAFRDYCDREKVEHVLITTGVPRGNGQVERLNRTIIAILTKLSLFKPEEWFKHVNKVQQYINASFNRSIGATPFEILIGRKMRLPNDLELHDLVQQSMCEIFQEERSVLRDEAKKNINKIQQENRKTANRKRKQATEYVIGDLVAIRRSQIGPGLKVYPKFLGPYKVIQALRNNRYLVEKVGEHQGPNSTSTSADNMKQWPLYRGWDPDIDEIIHSNDEQDDNCEMNLIDVE